MGKPFKAISGSLHTDLVLKFDKPLTTFRGSDRFLLKGFSCFSFNKSLADVLASIAKVDKISTGGKIECKKVILSLYYLRHNQRISPTGRRLAHVLTEFVRVDCV